MQLCTHGKRKHKMGSNHCGTPHPQRRTIQTDKTTAVIFLGGVKNIYIKGGSNKTSESVVTLNDFCHSLFKELDERRVVAPVYIRNIKGHNTFLEIRRRKTTPNLAPLCIFHHNDDIRPVKVFLIYRIAVIEASRSSVESLLKEEFCRLTPILFLVANEEDLHVQ